MKVMVQIDRDAAIRIGVEQFGREAIDVDISACSQAKRELLIALRRAEDGVTPLIEGYVSLTVNSERGKLEYTHPGEKFARPEEALDWLDVVAAKLQAFIDDVKRLDACSVDALIDAFWSMDVLMTTSSATSIPDDVVKTLWPEANASMLYGVDRDVVVPAARSRDTLLKAGWWLKQLPVHACRQGADLLGVDSSTLKTYLGAAFEGPDAAFRDAVQARIERDYPQAEDAARRAQLTALHNEPLRTALQLEVDAVVEKMRKRAEELAVIEATTAEVRAILAAVDAVDPERYLEERFAAGELPAEELRHVLRQHLFKAFEGYRRYKRIRAEEVLGENRFGTVDFATEDGAEVVTAAFHGTRKAIIATAAATDPRMSVSTRTHVAILDGEVRWRTPVVRVGLKLPLASDRYGGIELSREYVPN